ncbi:4-hydroxy-tetrahydrodipicolinate reductase [Bryobacterales bacterium F-183]|nr:4-hydroxy-tetrahydrodipicolinate reductase [Bryobacterales bacterium F-183]
MKLAIVGYGKMGRMVESLAPEYGFTVHSRIDVNDPMEAAQGADAAIEFSTPEAAAGNLKKLAALKVNTVCGTTGWFAQLDDVRPAFDATGTALVYSPNFSVGVNIFFKLLEDAAKMLEQQPEYGAWAWEIHHDAKKDAPSGTLIKAVDALKAGGYTRHIDVSSNRAGKVPGTHEIGFDSAADTITLRHTARSREGFARGALQAAKWIVGKQGVHEFANILFQQQTTKGDK